MKKLFKAVTIKEHVIVECETVEQLEFLCKNENIKFSQSYDKIFDWVRGPDHICVNISTNKWGRRISYLEDGTILIKFKDFYKDYKFTLLCNKIDEVK